MTTGIGHLGFTATLAPTLPSGTRAESPSLAPAPARPPHPVDSVHLSVPPEIPADTLAAVQVAAARVAELAVRQRELHFQLDQHSSRVIIEVRDFDGNVLRTIPPSKALEIMSTTGEID